jgi:dTDP-4-dehydrorhamnose reductase
MHEECIAPKPKPRSSPAGRGALAAPLYTMTARIVLFGINGQVGSRLNEALTAAGYDVTGIDRARCDFAAATAKDVAVIIRAVEPSIVINAAAYTSVDQAEREPELAQRINVQLPGFIASSSAEQQVPCVHFSTDYVFDGVHGAPYAEAAPANPLGVYAKSKHEGEQAARAHGAHVFRLQWVFDTRCKNFFLTMKKLLAEREEVRVVADQLGAPSHAKHIADAITQLAPRLIRGEIPADIYHLTAGGFTSWHGFACAIADVTKSTARVVPIVTSEYPTLAPRPKDARLNTSKLASHGIAMPHWREGLAEALKP